MMARLAKKAFWAVVVVIAAGFVPTTASAKDLCLQTTDGVDIVLDNFLIKKGTMFPVSGWVVKSLLSDLGIDIVRYSPASGSAIASADGSKIAVELTQGTA